MPTFNHQFSINQIGNINFMPIYVDFLLPLQIPNFYKALILVHISLAIKLMGNYRKESSSSSSQFRHHKYFKSTPPVRVSLTLSLTLTLTLTGTEFFQNLRWRGICGEIPKILSLIYVTLSRNCTWIVGHFIILLYMYWNMYYGREIWGVRWNDRRVHEINWRLYKSDRWIHENDLAFRENGEWIRENNRGFLENN